MPRTTRHPSLARRAAVGLGVALLVLAVAAPATTAAAAKTKLVSRSTDGTRGDSYSRDPSISGNGRYVAFESNATNLVGNDTNGKRDVFVHDRKTGKTKRVSKRSDGTEGDNDSGDPSISDDGRYIAFDSNATNLVKNDTNGVWDVFVHDRKTGKTKRVSKRSDGTEGDNYSGDPSISDDGRYLAFESDATNLVGNDTNGARDIFVHDRKTHKTKRVSKRSDGTEGDSTSYDPSISGNGRYVAFASYATNLVKNDTNGSKDVFRRGPLH